MKANSFMRLAQALIRRYFKLFRLLINWLIAPMELIYTRNVSTGAVDAGPVFIVGAPRSGTTFLIQLITAAFNFAYLSNRHCRWFRAPVFMEKLKPTPFGSCRNFKSEFGLIAGPHAPSECGLYWYRFLPRRPHTLSASDMDPDRLRSLWRAVNSMSTVVARPLIFKNLILSLRIPVLVEAFPNALFIVCHRSPADTAASILQAREQRFGTVHQWFSLIPANCWEMDETQDVFEQVTAQIRGTHDEIERARSALPGDRFIDVDYESLCGTPRNELQRIQDWLAAAGIQVNRHSGFECPPRFNASRNFHSVPDEWRNRINASLNNGALV